MTKHIIDGASILRGPAETAESSSQAEVGLPFDWLKPNHPRNAALAAVDLNGMFKAAFKNVTTAGSGVVPTAVEFYIEVDTALNFPSAHKVASITFGNSETPPANFELVIPRSLLYNLEPTATHIRVGCGITGGTTPSLDYECYLTKY